MLLYEGVRRPPMRRTRSVALAALSIFMTCAQYSRLLMRSPCFGASTLRAVAWLGTSLRTHVGRVRDVRLRAAPHVHFGTMAGQWM
jgi:hypothetical protein